MDLQTGHLADRYHAQIIMYYEVVFVFFFPNQFFQNIVFFLRCGVRKVGGI